MRLLTVRNLFLIILLPVMASADDFGSTLKREAKSAEHVPVETGDLCIVGGMELSDKDTVLMLRGRRVPVSSTGMNHFLKEPEKYFTKLQPKGALFSEENNLTKPSWSWFIFGIGVVVLLLLFGAKGTHKIKKLLLGTKVPDGLTKIPHTATPTTCPKCKSANHPAASKCSSCDEPLSSNYQPEAKRV